MPVPLDTYYTSKFDASETPPAPYVLPWMKNHVEKYGQRWVEGDRKDQVLPYWGRIARGKMKSQATSPWYGPWYYAPNPFSSFHRFSGNDWSLNSPPTYGVAAVNKCYDRFKDVAVGETASWGTTIAEGREALGLIGDRALRLRRAYKNLRRGQFKDFLKELSVKPKRKHRSVTRTASGEASGLWLEYWFGWSPLAGEIYQSTVALTAAQVAGKHFATAWQACKEHVNSGDGLEVKENGKYRVKTGATIRYDSLDRMLATQMGLTNPLAIAWELVPFSFVVDWFTGIGNVLGARSDFYGTTLFDAYWTEKLETSSQFSTWEYYGGDPISTRYVAQYKSFLQRRHLGLIRPVATYPKVANFGDSGTRAATAVSLLVQIFLDK